MTRGIHKRILAMEPDIDTFNNDIFHLDTEAVAAAIENGNIDVNQEDYFKHFPLQVAIFALVDNVQLLEKKLSIIKLLVENGVNLEQEFDTTDPPEFVALENAIATTRNVGFNLHIIKALLDYGADPNHTYHDHETVFQRKLDSWYSRNYVKLLFFYGGNWRTVKPTEIHLREQRSFFQDLNKYKVATDLAAFYGLENLTPEQRDNYQVATDLAAIDELENLTPEQRAIQRAILLDMQDEFVSVASTSQGDRDRLNSLFAKAAKLKWTPVDHSKFLPRFDEQTKAFITSAEKFSDETKDFTQMPIEVLHHIVSFSYKPSDVNVSKLE